MNGKTEGCIAGGTLPGGASGSMEECYENLVTAIVKQAVRDYERILLQLFSRPTGEKQVRLNMEKVELEVFFHSAWYGTLTDIDGDRLIRTMRSHALDKVKEIIRKKHQKRLKEMGMAAGGADKVSKSAEKV